MTKLIWLIVLATLAWRLLAGRWPWQYGRKDAERRKSLHDARRLLGLRDGASRQEIMDAHRQRLSAVHPDRGGSNEAVHQVNAARDVLLAQISQHPQEQP